MDEHEVITTSNARLWLDGGIVHSEALPGSVGTEQTVREWIDALQELTRGSAYPLCNDIRSVRTIGRSALTLALDEAAHLISTVADVVGPPISEMIMAAVEGDRQQPYARVVFTDVDEARRWLQQFVDRDGANEGG